MAKFETWLEMNLTLVDGGASAVKIVLEGPDGSAWGTWPREFPNLVQSIAGMLAALREELPRGRHAAKLIALSSDGMQLSCLPVTVTGASEQATNAAEQQLTAQRANALFLANVEKAQAGMMTILQHTSELVSQVVEANRNLTADAERSKQERDEGRIRLMREEGKQRRLDEVATKVLPIVELGLGLLTEFAAEWFQKREQRVGAGAQAKEKPELSTAEAATEVHSDHAETAGERERAPAGDEPAGAHHPGGNPQSERTQVASEGCPSGNVNGASERSSRHDETARGAAAGRKRRR